MDSTSLQAWIQENCPLVYGVLNDRARKRFPSGLEEYIGGDSLADFEAGKEALTIVEKALTKLVDKCGRETVGGTYRRELSAVTSVNQVAELFCEIGLCASLSDLSQKVKLRPRTGKSTYSDCLVTINGSDLYGEAKRYEDPWPYIEKVDSKSERRIPYTRSIDREAPGKTPFDNARPRSMDLRSKLRDVHRQFPDCTLNVLFIFHPSLGETRKYLSQVLFGDSAFHVNDGLYSLEKEGLFSVEEWRNISACYLARVNIDGKVIFPAIWENPWAWVPLPQIVSTALKP